MQRRARERGTISCKQRAHPRTRAQSRCTLCYTLCYTLLLHVAVTRCVLLLGSNPAVLTARPFDLSPRGGCRRRWDARGTYAPLGEACTLLAPSPADTATPAASTPSAALPIALPPASPPPETRHRPPSPCPPPPTVTSPPLPPPLPSPPPSPPAHRPRSRNGLTALRRGAATAQPVPSDSKGRQLLSFIVVSNAQSIEHATHRGARPRG